MLWVSEQGVSLFNIRSNEVWIGKRDGNSLIIQKGQKDDIQTETIECESEKEASLKWWQERWAMINDGYMAYTDPSNTYDNSLDMVTRLFNAIRNRNFDDIISAVEEGADPNCQPNGMSLLYTAVARNKAELLSLLLSKEANTEALNITLTGLDSLKSPLLDAILKDKEEFIETLLKSGASIDNAMALLLDKADPDLFREFEKIETAYNKMISLGANAQSEELKRVKELYN